MKSKKYEFTGEIKNDSGRMLHRIRALTNFGTVKAGDLGGWIEKEENLSQDGNCWVYGDAIVCDNARVYENAKVFDKVLISEDSQVFGHAQISGHVRIFGMASIRDNAQVFGDSLLFNLAQVYGNSTISGNARVHGNAHVADNAWILQDADVYGHCRICGNAVVYGHSTVFDTLISGCSRICGNALVSGSDKIISISNIGPWKETVTFFTTKDGGIGVVAPGDFYGEEIDTFEKWVHETHGDDKYAKIYLLSIELAKLSINTDTEDK